MLWVLIIVFGFVWILEKSSDKGGPAGGVIAFLVIITILALMGFR